MRIRIFFNVLLALLLTVADSTAVHAQSLSGQGTCKNTLQAGDVGNIGTANNFYESALGPTWLRALVSREKESFCVGCVG